MKESESNLDLWDILCLILITLKLLGEIDLHWIWVWAPLWGKYVVSFGAVFVGWIIENWWKFRK